MSEHIDMFGNALVPVKLESIEQVELRNNVVLIEVPCYMYEDYETAVLKLRVDPTFIPYQYVVRHGTIVKKPELVTPELNSALGWSFDLDILKEGDVVWFSGSSSYSSDKIQVGDKLYMLINVGDLYLVKLNVPQKLTYIMLNDNVLISPLINTVTHIGMNKKEEDATYGIVTSYPVRRTNYLNGKKSIVNDLFFGAKVVLPAVKRTLEIEPYLYFERKKYYICQSWEIPSVYK